jgi:hypothetical protein
MIALHEKIDFLLCCEFVRNTKRCFPRFTDLRERVKAQHFLRAQQVFDRL